MIGDSDYEFVGDDGVPLGGTSIIAIVRPLPDTKNQRFTGVAAQAEDTII